jgi:putative hydrolase of the HAD superfamily
MEAMKGVLIDVGGVLVANLWSDAATAWGARLGISVEQFMTALFGGNDDQVLIGRVSEADWWEVVRLRLAVDRRLIDALRADLARRETWDVALVGSFVA